MTLFLIILAALALNVLLGVVFGQAETEASYRKWAARKRARELRQADREVVRRLLASLDK